MEQRYPTWSQMCDEEREEKTTVAQLDRCGMGKFLGMLLHERLGAPCTVPLILSPLVQKKDTIDETAGDLEMLYSFLRVCGLYIENKVDSQFVDMLFAEIRQWYFTSSLPGWTKYKLEELLEWREGRWMERKKFPTPVLVPSSPSPLSSSPSPLSSSPSPLPTVDTGTVISTETKKTKLGKNARKRAQKQKEYQAVDQASQLPLSTPLLTQDETPSTNVTQSGMTKEEEAKRQKHLEDIWEEYFISQDIEEATECVKELQDITWVPYFVSLGFSLSIQKRDKEREQACALLKKMFFDAQLTKNDLEKGIQTIHNELDDLKCDVPMAPSYFKEMLAVLSPLNESGWTALAAS